MTCPQARVPRKRGVRKVPPDKAPTSRRPLNLCDPRLPEDITSFSRLAANLQVREVGNQPPELHLVERGPRVLLRQHAVEGGVLAFERHHRVVDQLADRGIGRPVLQHRPARILRHPEEPDRRILVAVLGIGAVRFLRHEVGMVLVEGVGDVFEEDETEHDLLVLGGVHVPPQGIGGAPEFGFFIAREGLGAGSGRLCQRIRPSNDCWVQAGSMGKVSHIPHSLRTRS
jgi:hypothetical protein